MQIRSWKRSNWMRGLAFVICSITLLSASVHTVKVRSRARLRQAKRSGAENAPCRKSAELARQPCTTLPWDDKLVIAARNDEDVSWMAVHLNPWIPFLVYSTNGDKAATHKTLSSTGREAHAYLQFIVDYYECLPQEMAFIHAHETSPHSPYILADLRRLKWGSIPGFVSLSRPLRTSTFYLTNAGKHRPALDDKSEVAHWMEFAFEQNLRIQAAWPEIFQELGDIPEELTAPCCGQFAVTRERLYQYPKEFYQDALSWLQATRWDSFWAGLVFEHTWAHMFGAGPIYTPPKECDIFVCDRNSTQNPPKELRKPPKPGCCSVGGSR